MKHGHTKMGNVLVSNMGMAHSCLCVRGMSGKNKIPFIIFFFRRSWDTTIIITTKPYSQNLKEKEGGWGEGALKKRVLFIYLYNLAQFERSRSVKLKSISFILTLNT